MSGLRTQVPPARFVLGARCFELKRAHALARARAAVAVIGTSVMVFSAQIACGGTDGPLAPGDARCGNVDCAIGFHCASQAQGRCAPGCLGDDDCGGGTCDASGVCVGVPDDGDTDGGDSEVATHLDTSGDDATAGGSDGDGESDSEGGSDGEGGSDTVSQPTSCEGAFGFGAAAVEWTLPYALWGAGFSNNVISNENHVLLDLDGDGRLDFVVIRDVERPNSDPLVGKNHWLVFRNTGAGFASTAEQWALPYPLRGADFDFNQVGNSKHLLLDLDGDGKLDFVQFENGERPTSDPLLGKSHWLVFKNTGSGFARSSTDWRLPYALLNNLGDFNETGTDNHSLLDLDGDGKLDFVVVRDRERPDSDPLTGKNHWLVFANTGSGFAQTPTTWRLPFALVIQGDQSRNAIGTSSHALVDLDGDSLLDFVVNRDNERESGRDPLVGKNHWLVFANTGQGFAASPVTWGLPFPLIGGGNDYSTTGNENHGLLDPSADGKVDFVVVRDVERSGSDALTGKHHWPVFVNTGTRFATAPQPWGLPYTLTGVVGDHNHLATQHHSLVDLDADGLLDFVEYANGERSANDVLLGKNHWRVYPGACQ